MTAMKKSCICETLGFSLCWLVVILPCVAASSVVFPLTIVLMSNIHDHQVGKLHVVDPTAEEEACARGHLLVAVNKAGAVCSVYKGGRGGVSPAAIVELLRLAQQKGTALIDALDAKLASSAPSLKNREL